MSRKNKQKFKFATQPVPATHNHQIAVPPVLYKDRSPAFSFKYFDEQHKDYNFDAIQSTAEWKKFVKHLKYISQTTWGEMEKAPHIFHAHGVDWKSSDEPRGFQNLSFHCAAYQFKSFDEFRVLGFFNKDNIFEVVWFDRHHKVYKNRKFN